MSPNQEPQIVPKIDNLILIDRSVDYLTPMMTQLTYEGLVDEYLGIKYSRHFYFIYISCIDTPDFMFVIKKKAQVELSPDKKKTQSTSDNKVNVVELKKSIVILNSSDSLFAEIRDKNFNAINHVLSRTAKELQQANEVSLILVDIFGGRKDEIEYYKLQFCEKIMDNLSDFCFFCLISNSVECSR